MQIEGAFHDSQKKKHANSKMELLQIHKLDFKVKLIYTNQKENN
jgi:hypothetical protein